MLKWWIHVLDSPVPLWVFVNAVLVAALAVVQSIRFAARTEDRLRALEWKYKGIDAALDYQDRILERLSAHQRPEFIQTTQGWAKPDWSR